MALTITTDNLQELIDSGKPVVIDFWAEWCGPCRMIGPMIDELHEQYGEQAMIGKCDIESNNDIALKYMVRNIPTVLYLKGGEVVDKQVGATNKAKLEEKLTKLL